jgi:hypothetical protein
MDHENQDQPQPEQNMQVPHPQLNEQLPVWQVLVQGQPNPQEVLARRMDAQELDLNFLYGLLNAIHGQYDWQLVEFQRDIDVAKTNLNNWLQDGRISENRKTLANIN